jgi:hypothetical protein
MVPQTVQMAPALISGLDLFGIAVFAASGALAAAQRQQTLVTFHSSHSLRAWVAERCAIY